MRAGTAPTAQDVATAQKIGQPMMGVDYGGPETQDLAAEAAGSSAANKRAFTAPMDQRASDTANRGIQMVKNWFGGADIDEAARIRAINDEAKATNTPAYTDAYTAGDRPLWNDNLANLSRTAPMQAAIRDATQTANTQAAITGRPVVQNPFVKDPATGEMTLNATASGGTPNLEYWNIVKQNLDDQISSAPNGSPQARMLTQLKAKLLNPTDGLDGLVPEYAQARSGAYGFFQAKNALEAGTNVLDKDLSPTELTTQMSKMTPQQRDDLSYGTATALMQRMGNGGTKGLINTYFNNQRPWVTQKITAALGQDKANELETFLRMEDMQGDALKAVNAANPKAEPTGLIQMALHHAGGPLAGAVIGGGEEALRTDFEPGAIAKGSAVGFVSGLLGKAYNGQNSRLMNGVTQALSSKDPEVYQMALKQLSRDPQGLAAVRSANNRISTIAQAAANPRASNALRYWTGQQ